MPLDTLIIYSIMREFAELGKSCSLEEMPSFRRFLASENARKEGKQPFNDVAIRRMRLELEAASGPRKI
jgi:hypothetical protein